MSLMTDPQAASASEVHRLAVEKMSAVLGPEKTNRLLRRILEELGIELRTAQDLLRFSESLSRLGGFEGSVGAMLGVAAIIRGARPATNE